MSAPLVVNTIDGTCWTRRASTRGGLALYAMAEVPSCPDVVMATYEELVEHGIAGEADALPMPVGLAPQVAPVDADRAKAPWGRGEDGRPRLPMGAHWTDIPELVDRTVARIQARLDEAQSGHWYVASATETWLPAGTVRTRVDGYPRTVGQFTNVLPADLALILHAHDDLSWCLEMVAKLRARVAELEAATHVAPSPSCTRCYGADAVRLVANGGATEPCRVCNSAQAVESADRLTALLAPTQALTDDAAPGVPCSKCGDPVTWAKSTNSDGGFWRHIVVPGRVLEHFAEVAGAEGRHTFEKEHQGESDAKRRLARCKHCGEARTAPMHVETGGAS